MGVPTGSEVPLEGGGSTPTARDGGLVLRESRPWTRSVHAVLEHLERQGLACAPRVAGDGFAADGRETLYFIEGDVGPPSGGWSDDGIWKLGQLLADAHGALLSFDPPPWVSWMPWWGRSLPGRPRIVGHCDAAPWNVIARDGIPVALIDWDTTGPVGQLWDLAQAVWLNAQLHDDDVAERQGLPPAALRAARARVMCDGYGLEATRRQALIDLMIELAVRTAAQEAIDAGVSLEGTQPQPFGLLGGGPPFSGHELLWAVTWRVRSARWMLDNRQLLERALGTV